MAWLTKNIALGRPLPTSLWRKVSISSWGVTRDSSVVTVLELDAEPALKRIAAERERTGRKITLTHLAGQALAQVFARHPEINCLYRWGKLYPRPSADICFLVANGTGRVGEGEDLSGIVVRECDRKSPLEIATDLESAVKEMKSGKDLSFKGIKQGLAYLPHFIRKPLVNLADFIMHSLNLWSPILGLKQDAFGSAMLTSVGSFGIDFAIARIYPQSRNSVMLAVGAAKDAPVVRGGQVVVGKRIKFVFTADHRVVDGLHAAYMLKTFQEVFES